jgi:transcriptional regulator with XRE-family HTH domain
MERRIYPDSRLRQERIRRGLTQKHLALALGCSSNAVSRWEWDNREPRRAVRARLEKLFGLTWAALRAEATGANENG